MVAVIRKVPNKNTGKGYQIVKYPGQKIVSNQDTLTKARAKVKTLLKTRKKAYYVITTDIYESFNK